MSYILITVIITVINLKLMKLLIHFFIIRKGDSCGSIKIQPTTWSDQALSCIHKGTSNSRYRIYACKEGISQYQSWHCISKPESAYRHRWGDQDINTWRRRQIWWNHTAAQSFLMYEMWTVPGSWAGYEKYWRDEPSCEWLFWRNDYFQFYFILWRMQWLH